MAIDIEQLNDEVKRNTSDIIMMKNDLTRLETLFQGLKDLPQVIHKLDKTLISFEGKLDLMNMTICNISDENKKQNEILSETSCKGNINIVDFITKNFWKIIGIVCIAGYVLHDSLKVLKG